MVPLSPEEVSDLYLLDRGRTQWINILATIALDPVGGASLLWPLIGFWAVMDGKYGRLSVVLASITIGIALLLVYTYQTSFPFGDLLFLTGMYAGIRSRRIWRDAYRLNRFFCAPRRCRP